MKHDTGRWHLPRKAYKKARVKKLCERYYKRVKRNPVVLLHWDRENGWSRA